MRVLFVLLVSIFLLCEGQHVEIRVTFGYSNSFYRCVAREFLITQNGTQTTVIVGNHLPNMTNLDVNQVEIFNQPIPFVIREFFTTFPNLDTLFIFGGLLQRIQDDAFAFAQNLTLIAIFNIPIRVLPANFLAGTKIQNFQISNCAELEKIDQNAFYGLNTLEDIHIRNTRIKFIPENVFSTLPNLLRVSLQDNPIQTLPSEIFHNNFRLRIISLFNNRINAIGRNLVENFVNLPDLGTFSLNGNVCANSGFIAANIPAIHEALQDCYRNYVQRRHFELELQGSLVIRDENGDVIFDSYVSLT